MLETIGSIVLKYWVELILGLIVTGGGFLIKRYLRLEKEERQREQKEYFDNVLKKIQSENQQALKSLEKEHDKMNQNSEDKYDEINTKVDKALEAGREESKSSSPSVSIYCSRFCRLFCIRSTLSRIYGSKTFSISACG